MDDEIQGDATVTVSDAGNSYWIDSLVAIDTNFIPEEARRAQRDQIAREQREVLRDTQLNQSQLDLIEQRLQQYEPNLLIRDHVYERLLQTMRQPVPSIPSARLGSSATSGQQIHVTAPNPPENPVEIAVQAIRKFMNLPEQLQGFLVEMCKHPIERDVILIFNDWLQQNGEQSLALLVEEEVKKEREACLEIVENGFSFTGAEGMAANLGFNALNRITNKIRARGNKGEVK